MQLAAIDYDGWQQYTAVVYEDGRLIFPHDSNGYTLCDTYEEAHAIITRYYPHAKMVTPEEIEPQYNQEGYYYPFRKYGKTNLLCHACNSMLILDKNSRGIAENSPHGVMYHIWYTCSGCKRAYAEERIAGNPSYEGWDYKDVESEKFIECNRPNHIPYRNPYDFQEIILLKQKEIESNESL